jgi:perosamine synthetase
MPDPVVNPRAARKIPVAKPSLGEAEARAVADAVRSGWISQGPLAERFERTFAQWHGKRHGVSCNSGTTALHLALKAAGVSPGDEVVLPTLTMVACANAVLYCGAAPRFVDSEPSAGNADPAWWDRVVTPRTKAVIVPHLYGVPAMAFLKHVRAQSPRTAIVEDCAECHYATVEGKPVGSFGWFATFSFYANKIVASGEGGMVLTNCDRTAERLRGLRSHAFSPHTHFCHQELAFGVRYTDLQAAVALAQHDRRSQLLQRRDEIAQRYIGQLKGLADVEFQVRTFESVWWVFPLLARDRPMRDRLRRRLAEAGVETRSYFVPLHRQRHLSHYAEHDYPVADSLSDRGLYLPLWPDMTDDEVDYVAEIVRGGRQ